MSAVKYYASGGQRYYIIAVPGFTIIPGQDRRTGSGTYKAPSTYAVLDRDWMHREMGVFTPSGGGRSERWARRSAERLAEKLNEREEQAT